MNSYDYFLSNLYEKINLIYFLFVKHQYFPWLTELMPLLFAKNFIRNIMKLHLRTWNFILVNIKRNRQYTIRLRVLTILTILLLLTFELKRNLNF